MIFSVQKFKYVQVCMPVYVKLVEVDRKKKVACNLNLKEVDNGKITGTKDILGKRLSSQLVLVSKSVCQRVYYVTSVDTTA